MKTNRVSASFTDEIMADLNAMAESTGLSLSALVRQMVVQQIGTMKIAVEVMKDNDKMLSIIQMLKDTKENE